MLQSILAPSLGVSAPITCAYHHKQSDGIRILDVQASSIREERSSLLPHLHATRDFDPVAAVAVHVLECSSAEHEGVLAQAADCSRQRIPNCRTKGDLIGRLTGEVNHNRVVRISRKKRCEFTVYSMRTMPSLRANERRYSSASTDGRKASSRSPKGKFVPNDFGRPSMCSLQSARASRYFP